MFSLLDLACMGGGREEEKLHRAAKKTRSSYI